MNVKYQQQTGYTLRLPLHTISHKTNQTNQIHHIPSRLLFLKWIKNQKM